MPKAEKDTAQKLERDLRKADTVSEVKLVESKAKALAKIQKLKK